MLCFQRGLVVSNFGGVEKNLKIEKMWIKFFEKMENAATASAKMFRDKGGQWMVF